MNRNGSPNLRDFERFLRMAVHLKFLFGSPRSSIIVLLVLGVVITVGYFGMRSYFNPQSSIAQADKIYQSDKMEGVKSYKELLLKTDFWDPEKRWIGAEDRPRFYRRIISFEARYGELGEALDYCRKAWDEGIATLTFEYEETNELWKNATKDLRGGNRGQNSRNNQNGRDVWSNNLQDGKTDLVNESDQDADKNKSEEVEEGPQPPGPDPENKAKLPAEQTTSETPAE